MDWNWFFSSFSQSAAALLGIIGAFIISRLIGIDEKRNVLTSEFDDLVISYNKIKELLSVRKYDWLNRIFIKYDDDLIKKIQNREFDNISDDEILGELYQQDNRLYKSDTQLLISFKELYEKYKPKEEPIRKPGEVYITHNPLPILNIPPDGMWDNVSRERELINDYLIEASELIRKFNKNHQSIGGFIKGLSIINKIVWTLIISFPILVVYPLHFLPIEIGQIPELTFDFCLIIKMLFTVKSFLLLIFIISIESIFIYFLVLIKQIREVLSNHQDNNIDEYTNIKSYCEYYRE